MTSSNSTPLDLEITVVSAKHLKNVNWRNGEVKPYATFYLDPDHRHATRPDDSGSTRPVWNERFCLPLTRPVHDSVLTLEIFHSRPSETPKPLVGALRFSLTNLVGDSDDSTRPIRTLELLRPSGRPQGKVRLKLALLKLPAPLPDYFTSPRSSQYLSSVPAPSPPPIPTATDYSEHFHSSFNHSDQYSTGHYYPPPSLPSRTFFNRASNCLAPGGPSAPVDFSPPNDHKSLPPPTQPYNCSAPGGPSAPFDSTRYDRDPPGGSASYLSATEGLSTAERVGSESVARDSDRYSSYSRGY
ncbi:hypothetical protein CJ030_MR6G009088 [Morella rubra]|uniref:C2 domain-containing protein n=1 Tax=Morella rubra TaxID=262757 RepID=A0A6A1VFQ1_9ROSI|nr:hypothetical protein CJ030_MR6G009088 [Morella rubra]